MATRRSNHTTRIAVIFGLAIACLGLPQSAQAAEYYVAATGNDSTGTGTVSNPWRTISRVQSVLSPGDTVYCSGNFGVLDFTGYKCGTDGHWITYQAWPSMTVPTLTSLAFERAPLDYRIKFVGFTFDPGYVAESVSAVYLYGASYLIFETCHFEGAKNNAAYLAGKPYAPYSFENNTVIYTRGGDVFPTHITIRNSHLMYGCSVISPYGACHDWVIEGNEIEEFSDNGIQIRDGAYDVLIQRNNIHDGNCYKNVYSWPGTSIVSDWATHKGATVKSKKRMEDGSEVEVTGIFHNYSDGRMSVYIDNPATIPDRGSTYAWTLDGATFFTPSSGGDNDHSDGVSIEGTSHDIDVYRNTIHRITGQGIKVGEDGGASTNIRICSNLIYDTGAYSAYFETGEIYFYNNTVDNSLGMRLFLAANMTMFNNLIANGITAANQTVSGSYNTWGSTPDPAYLAGTDNLVLSAANFTALFSDRAAGVYTLGNPGTAGAPHNSILPVKIQNSYFNQDFLGVSWNNPPSRGAYEYAPSPLLAFTLVGTNSVVVSWQSSSTNFVLQQNQDLTTTNWSNFNGTVGDNNIIKSVTNNLSAGHMFFRLVSR